MREVQRYPPGVASISSPIPRPPSAQPRHPEPSPFPFSASHAISPLASRAVQVYRYGRARNALCGRMPASTRWALTPGRLDASARRGIRRCRRRRKRRVRRREEVACWGVGGEGEEERVRSEFRGEARYMREDGGRVAREHCA